MTTRTRHPAMPADLVGINGIHLSGSCCEHVGNPLQVEPEAYARADSRNISARLSTAGLLFVIFTIKLIESAPEPKKIMASLGFRKKTTVQRNSIAEA